MYLKIKELERGDVFTYEGKEWKKECELLGAGIIASRKENGKVYHSFICNEREVFQ